MIWIKSADDIVLTIVGGLKKHGGPCLGPTRAKTQGFPSNWEIVGKKTSAYRQIGDALPSSVSSQIKKVLVKVRVVSKIS